MSPDRTASPATQDCVSVNLMLSVRVRSGLWEGRDLHANPRDQVVAELEFDKFAWNMNAPAPRRRREGKCMTGVPSRGEGAPIAAAPLHFA